MRVAILTHQLGTNYGGVLQNYALQQVLRILGHEPITLNHRFKNPYTLPVKIASFFKQLYKRSRGCDEQLRIWMTDSEKKYIAKNINRFIESNINCSPTFITDDLKHNLPEGLEAVVVGSDQVWNPHYMKPIERFFLSDFGDKDIIKLAYAASFGGEKWEFTEQQTNNCSILARSFKAISVRENTGVEMCKKHLDVNAQLVLDPTLLLDVDLYKGLLAQNKTTHKKSMMVYVLDRTQRKKQIVNDVASRMSLEINTVMPQSSFRKVGSAGLDQCVFPGIETWLEGFEQADFVITDSFHGTVFSIIFNKPFITILNKERGADRFTSLLGLLGLDNRLVDINDDYLPLLNESISYPDVNKKLESLRENSITFLQQALD